MNKHISLLTLLIFTSLINAQTDTTPKESFAIFNFGRSFNGTGDISGFHYGISYAEYIKNKKMYWQLAFEGTLHDDEEIDYFFQDQDGNNLDGKSRYVIGGFQLVTSFGYNFIKSNRHDFGLSIGPLLRYQSNSSPDIITTLFPIITELPFPVQVSEYFSPLRTVSLGGSFRLNYNYKLNNNYLIGFTGAFQTDTNGDAIRSVMVSFGKIF